MKERKKRHKEKSAGLIVVSKLGAKASLGGIHRLVVDSFVSAFHWIEEIGCQRKVSSVPSVTKDCC